MSELLNIPNSELWVYGVTFSSFADIDNNIQKEEHIKESIKNELLMYSISTPKDITPSDKTPFSYIEEHITELLADYEDSCNTCATLYQVRGIIEKYALMHNINVESAFNLIYVDKYADLRSNLNLGDIKHNGNNI